jgi:hypothetical protein
LSAGFDLRLRPHLAWPLLALARLPWPQPTCASVPSRSPSRSPCPPPARRPSRPLGVGALLVARNAADLLTPTYFGGGSTVDATAEDAWHIKLPAPEGLEPGTLPFTAIAGLKHGFNQLDALGGMEVRGFQGAARGCKWGEWAGLARAWVAGRPRPGAAAGSKQNHAGC